MTLTRRRYDEGCIAAAALDVVGDRWALLVVRELVLSPKRFQAIRGGLPGITAAVLSTRLRQLAEEGILTRHPTLGHYELTPRGHALRPVLLALAAWGARLPSHDPTLHVSPTALMLSMTIMIDADAATGRRTVAGFDLGAERFTSALDGAGQVLPVAAPAGPLQAQFVLGGTGNTLAMAVYGPHPLAELVAAGTIRLTGDPGAAQEFVDLFALPRGE
ncbi:MAG: helix-turn-helix domain-containing protein [Dermatophilaceae bacterium]